MRGWCSYLDLLISARVRGLGCRVISHDFVGGADWVGVGSGLLARVWVCLWWWA